MTGYTKLFNSIITSTIWCESPVVCKVWVTMLALADRDGLVEASLPGLAHLARLGIEEASEAIQKFLSPDPYSRSPEWDGRRIEPIDGGWRILNYIKYRLRMSPEDIRERDRIRKQRYREQQRKKGPTEGGTDWDNSEMSAESDKSIKQERKTQNENKIFAHPLAQHGAIPRLSASTVKTEREKLTSLASSLYTLYPRKVAKANALRAIEKAIVSVARRDFEGDLDQAAGWLKGRVTKPARNGIPTLATEDHDLTKLLLAQAITATHLPFGQSNDSLNERFAAAAVRSLGPRDVLEALLSVQMVQTHNLAVEYLRRAAIKDQTTVGIELYTNFANRLLRTYVAQVEALKTYRSKGEQKVEVKHVHVHPGGQAIVGAVSHAARGAGDKN
jgi:hypothetical protein